MMVCSGNLDRTSFTNSTKCSEYPLATSRQINLTCGTASRMLLIFSRSFVLLPELTATCYTEQTKRCKTGTVSGVQRSDPASIHPPVLGTVPCPSEVHPDHTHSGPAQETCNSRGKGDSHGHLSKLTVVFSNTKLHINTKLRPEPWPHNLIHGF